MPPAPDGLNAGADTPGRRQRFGLVLVFITASFMVEGTLSGNDWAQFVVTALLGTTLLLTFWAADMKPRLLRRAAIAVVAAVAAVIVTVALGDNTAEGIGRLANAALVALAPPALVIGMLRSIRRNQAVTLEAVLGGLSLYVLVGMFFAFVFGAVDNLGGEPFFAQGVAATPERCSYFSFSTLTTVGFGDLTARGDLGRTLAVFEALVGSLYLVTVVSVGVSNLVPRYRLGGDR